jgi:rhodanese-related sulfurtransferase
MTTTTIPTVSPPDVAALCSQGKPIDLIDVRTPAEFATLHAQGARLVPLDRLDPRAIAGSRAASADEPIYIICKSGGRAAKACEMFQAAGIPNVLSVEGGTDAWQRAGLPVVRGQGKVISLERQVRIVAGLLVLFGVVLGWLVHPVLFGLAAFVGAGLTFAGITDWCGMGLMIARAPWNQRGADCAAQ